MNNIVTLIESKWELWIHKMGEKKFYPTVLLVLGCVGLLPLLYPGMPSGHDIAFHLTRIQGICDGLSAGQFPVKINATVLNGYGYGTGLFYPDLFLYIPAILVLVGLPIISAYKIFIFFLWFFSVFSMYYVIKKIDTNYFSAFAGALLYGWSSYFAVDIFNRAALGEVLTFPFVPFVILGLYKLIYDRPQKIFYLIIGFTGIFLAHQITFILTTLVAFVWCFFNIVRFLREPKRILYGILATITSLGLVLFFLLPMLEQIGYTEYRLTGETMKLPIIQHAIPITRLWLELPYMKLEYWIPSGIGLIFLIVFAQRFKFRSRGNNVERFRDYSLITAFGCLLAATNFLPWEGMMRQALAGIQFPWRFYLPATAFMALGCGLILGKIINKKPKELKRWIWILLIGCGFAWNFNVIYPYAAKIHEHDMTKGGKEYVGGFMYLPNGMLDTDIKDRGRVILAKNSIDLYPDLKNKQALSISFENNKSDNELELPLIPYKGYVATLETTNNHFVNIPVSISKKSFLSVLLPKEYTSGTISVKYAGTLLQKISGYISIVFLLLVIIYFFLCKRKKLL